MQIDPKFKIGLYVQTTDNPHINGKIISLNVDDNSISISRQESATSKRHVQQTFSNPNETLEILSVCLYCKEEIPITINIQTSNGNIQKDIYYCSKRHYLLHNIRNTDFRKLPDEKLEQINQIILHGD